MMVSKPMNPSLLQQPRPKFYAKLPTFADQSVMICRSRERFNHRVHRVSQRKSPRIPYAFWNHHQAGYDSRTHPFAYAAGRSCGLRIRMDLRLTRALARALSDAHADGCEYPAHAAWNVRYESGDARHH